MIYSYLRSDENSSIAVIINNDTKIHNIKIPFDSQRAIDLLTEKEYLIYGGGGIYIVELYPNTGYIKFNSELTRQKYLSVS